MKYLRMAPLCFAMLFLLCASGFAQSAEDTVLWLQPRLTAATQNGLIDLPITVDRDRIRFVYGGGGSEGWFTAEFSFKDMTSILVIPVPEGSDLHPYIQFMGISATYSRASGWVQGVKDCRSCFLRLPSASNEEAKRIAKALQHLAALNGAKVLKDDLF